MGEGQGSSRAREWSSLPAKTSQAHPRKVLAAVLGWAGWWDGAAIKGYVSAPLFAAKIARAVALASRKHPN